MSELEWIYVAGWLSCARTLDAYEIPDMALLADVEPTLDADAALMGEHGPAGAGRAYRDGVRSAYAAITVHAAVGDVRPRSDHVATAIGFARLWARKHGLGTTDG